MKKILVFILILGMITLGIALMPYERKEDLVKSSENLKNKVFSLIGKEEAPASSNNESQNNETPVAGGNEFGDVTDENTDNSLGADGEAANKENDVLVTALNKLKNAKGVSLSMKTIVKAEVNGGSYKATTDRDAILFGNPLKSKCSVNEKSTEGSIKYVTYIGKEKDSYYTYTNINDSWSKSSIKINHMNDLLVQNDVFDPDIYIQNKDEFTLEKTVTENGRELLVFKGSVKSSWLEGVSQLSDFAKIFQMDTNSLDETFFNDTLILRIWIDKKTSRIERVTTNLKKFMNIVIEQAILETGENVDLHFTKAYADITFRKYGNVKTFQIPKEARKIGKSKNIFKNE